MKNLFSEPHRLSGMSKTMMKCLTIGIVVALMGCTAAQASLVVTVSGANNSTTANGSSDFGTLSLPTAIVNNSAPPQSLAYTISGLDVDGIGGTNDSVNVNFTVTTDGGNFNTASAGYFSTGGSTINADDKFVQLTFSDLSVNLNGGTDNGSGSFDGFTNLTTSAWRQDAGDQAFINGVLQTATINGPQTYAVTGGGTSVNYEYEAGDGSRIGSVDFQFTAAVPEPSTLTLFGLGLAGLAFRRRRR